MENQPQTSLSGNFDADIALLKSDFKNDDMLVERYIENQNNPSIRFCLIFFDGMINKRVLDSDLIRPLTEYDFRPSGETVIDIVAKRVTLSDSVTKTGDINELIESLVYGDTLLVADGCDKALILNSKGWTTRSIIEPENEKILRGPREGFIESLAANLSMLRRRIRTSDLKMNFMTFGTRTKTKACICYIDSLVNKNALAELQKRLNSFTIDSALDVNYISEFIEDSHYSPIETIGSTERPDIVAAKLLEGRIAIFLDGTPVVLTCPYLFIENFQSNEDYYINHYFATFGRFLRIIAFFLSTGTPAIYLALTTFHHEMLPSTLMMSIAMEREGVPFPTVIEAIGLLIVFEMLRETGTRMPNSIGQALSIAGALVIGQAAVDARIVSAPMIVIIGLAAITGLMIPRLKGFVIWMRFVLLLMVSIIGLYGYMICMIGVLVYLMNMTSLGIPIIRPNVSWRLKYHKDTLIRAPWPNLTDRPDRLSSDKVRLSRK